MKQGRPLYFYRGFFFYLSFSSPIFSHHRLDVYHTWCGLSANLGCRSETCCTGLAQNTGRKKSSKIHHQGTIAQLCRAISLQLRHASTIGKNLFSPICPHNMVNFGPLTAEIGSVIWGTPPNVNWFRVLAVLPHGTLVVDISQILRH